MMRYNSSNSLVQLEKNNVDLSRDVCGFMLNIPRMGICFLSGICKGNRIFMQQA